MVKATLDSERQDLALVFDDWAAFQEMLQKTRSEERFIVKLEARLGPGDELQITFVHGDVHEEARARVTQVFRSGSSLYGTAFEVVEWKTSGGGATSSEGTSAESSPPAGAPAEMLDSGTGETTGSPNSSGRK